jgi:hypothetical protein
VSDAKDRGDHARDPSSMFEILRDLEAEGYADDMLVKEGGRVLCRSCGEESPAGEFESTGLRRMEGASDPGDMAAVAGLTCPRCGGKGALVLRYGPEAGAEDMDVLNALEAR